MKVGIVQFQAHRDKAVNLKRILNYISKASAQGAALCAFPEFMMFYTDSKQTPSQLANLAEYVDGNFVQNILSAAKQYKIQVVGSFYEKSTVKNRVYDTAFIADKNGKLLSTYRKIHLYDALNFRESTKLVAGSTIAKPVRTSIGKLGIMICYDLRFPEMSRVLATAGSECLVVPSAWVQGYLKEDHWLAINKTRAIENGCYVIAPDQVGNIYCGRSLIVDPFGEILLDMKKRQGIGIVNIDQKKITHTRKILPLLKNRRSELYKIN